MARNSHGNWIGLKKLTPIASGAEIVRKHSRNVQFKRAVDEMTLVVGSIIEKRKEKSGKRPELKDENLPKPVIYLKCLSKDEIKSIVDGLKKKKKLNLRERKRK